MPSVYQLKPAFQNLLRPITKGLARIGVSANQVTVAAVLISGTAAGLIVFHSPAIWTFFLVPGVLFLRMALNAIDGMLAREHNMKTGLGTFLNELGDVFSDSMLYLAFAWFPGIPIWPLFGVVLLSVISEMTGVVAIQAGADRRYDGPMGKSDRAVLFGGIALALGFGIPTGPWQLWVLIGSNLLLLVTIVNRVHRALKQA
ncbi:MAG: CDP-alcohol phosphatidyltransferase family protein [Spirochaetia bacterium]|nr:CDP-alcohol phosphatidyltransferase family protein [Spirochaetia bacterium]